MRVGLSSLRLCLHLVRSLEGESPHVFLRVFEIVNESLLGLVVLGNLILDHFVLELITGEECVQIVEGLSLRQLVNELRALFLFLALLL